MKVFIIEQKVLLVANQYRIYRATEAGDKGEMVGFAHQKRFSFKEHFDIFTDESKTQVLFSVQAREVLDFGARYDVRDNDGKVIGVVGKAFKQSLLRSTWQVFTPDNESEPLFIAQERNKALAIFRRIWEILPYLNDAPFFLRYHFDFVKPNETTPVGVFEKTTLFRDHYLLRAENELDQAIDWRTLVALGIMMDALQSR